MTTPSLSPLNAVFDNRRGVSTKKLRTGKTRDSFGASATLPTATGTMPMTENEQRLYEARRYLTRSETER